MSAVLGLAALFLLLPQETMDFGVINARQQELQSRLPLLLVFDRDPVSALAARPPLSLPLLACFHILLYGCFLLPPFPFRRSLGLATITAVLGRLLTQTSGLGPGNDYALAIALFGEYQVFTNFFGCTYPPETNPALRRRGCEGGFAEWGWWDRLKAVDQMMKNRRGIGWGWELRTRPELQRVETRWRFILRHLLKAALIILIWPQLHSFFPTATSSLTAPLWERVLRCNICVLAIYCMIECSYSLLAALTVLLRISHPTSWPPQFGDITTCWSIRRTWAFWHHMLTYTLLSHSAWAANTLRLKRGARGTYFFRLFVAFFLSGLLHAVPAWAVSRTDAQSMAYFLLQAVGIVVEEAVGRPLGRWCGLCGEGWRGTMGRALAWAWTIVWMAGSNVLFVEGMVAIGMKPMIRGVDLAGWMGLGESV